MTSISFPNEGIVRVNSRYGERDYADPTQLIQALTAAQSDCDDLSIANTPILEAEDLDMMRQLNPEASWEVNASDGLMRTLMRP